MGLIHHTAIPWKYGPTSCELNDVANGLLGFALTLNCLHVEQLLISALLVQSVGIRKFRVGLYEIVVTVTVS